MKQGGVGSWTEQLQAQRDEDPERRGRVGDARRLLVPGSKKEPHDGF